MDLLFGMLIVAFSFVGLFAFAIMAMRGENRRSRLMNLHRTTTGNDRPDLANPADATHHSHLYQQLATEALIHQAAHTHPAPQADQAAHAQHSHHAHHHHSHHHHSHHHHHHHEAPPVHHSPPPDTSSTHHAPSFDSGSHHHHSS